MWGGLRRKVVKCYLCIIGRKSVIFDDFDVFVKNTLFNNSRRTFNVYRCGEACVARFDHGIDDQVVILIHTSYTSDAHLTTRMTRPSQSWSYGIGGTPSIFNARAPHVIRARAYARASRVRAREGAIFLRHSSISFFDIIYQKGCHPEVVILTTSGRPSERYTQVL